MRTPDMQRSLLRLLWPQRSLVSELAILIGLTVAMPLFEIASVASMGLLILSIQSPAASSGGGAAGKLLHLIAGAVPQRVVVTTAIVVAATFLAKSVVVLLQGYFVQIYSRDYQKNLASRLLRGYLTMPFEFHIRSNTAVLVHNVTFEVQQIVEGVLVNLILLISEMLVLIPLSALLVFIDPLASLTFVAALAFASVGLRAIMVRLSGPVRRRRDESTARVVKLAQSIVTGVREISVGGSAEYLLRRFDDASAVFVRASGSMHFLNVVPRVVLENIALASLLFIIAINSVLRGGANLAVIAVFVAAGYRLLPSLGRIHNAWFQMSYMLPSLRNLTPALIAALDATEVPKNPAPAMEPFDELKAVGLGYGYSSEAGAIVSNIDLTLRRGQMIGLVGSSGAGKTTLVNLLVGLLRPQAGHIALNGRPLNSDADFRDLRMQTAYVPQSVFIADDTMLNNITLGAPGNRVDSDRLREALDVSQTDDLLRQLPLKLETPLGEQGSYLSGGEAQRVGIARALYLGRHFVVLDEATSALDPETERRLIEALSQRREDLCILVVSHRESALVGCDRVYRLEGGRLCLETQSLARPSIEAETI